MSQRSRALARHCMGQDGFTMIEVLVAFTVLATMTIAVQRGIAASVNGTVRAGETLGAELVARTLMSAPLGTGPEAARTSSGTMNGYRWKIHFENVDLPVAAVNVRDGSRPKWTPMKMVIEVSAGRSRPTTLESIRLVGG